MNNPLADVLPPKARKYVYAGLALGSVVWSAYQLADGDWGQVVGGVLVALTGGMAASNTKHAAPDQP